MAVILHLFAVHEAHAASESEYVPDLSDWWAEPSIWQERELPSTVARPLEDAVFAQLEAEAYAMKYRRRFRHWLSPEEQHLLKLEQECLRRNVAMTTAHERSMWIAAQMGGEWSARGVRLALDDLSSMLIHAANEHVTDVLVRWGRRKLERGEKAQMLEELLKVA